MHRIVISDEGLPNLKKRAYNHDIAFNIMKTKLESMNCFKKYKSYTATNNIPVVLRNVELV